MNRTSRGPVALAAAFAAAAAVTVTAPATAGVAAPTQTSTTTAAVDTVSGASFTWGFSGYAQRGIFGPWSFTAPTTGVEVLSGSVSGGAQTDYVVAPVPVTSMPVRTDGSGTQVTPNAVRFTAGTGTVDRATGEADLAWAGSWTVNPYPPQFGAPDEIYADPELEVAADGSGDLSMEVTIGAGVDIDGNPTAATPLGRRTMMTFGAGSLSDRTGAGYRVTPGYQGVEVTVPADGSPQTTDCTATGGATGWWGSWAPDLVTAMPAATRPHFYSTGCGGLQDNKPPLPFDVGLGTSAPSVSVSQTEVEADGSTVVTVTGSGFDPALATGTRPPLAGRPSGAYISFGRFAGTWRPSQGAPSSARPGTGTKWAVLAADMNTIGGSAGGAVELSPDGSFTAAITVSKAAADTAAGDNGGAYGIYTYAGGGAVQAAYETQTPITFTTAPAPVVVGVKVGAFNTGWGTAVPVTVTVADAAGGVTPTGSVVARVGGSVVTRGALVDGVARLSLSALPVGTSRVVLTYAGSPTHARLSVARTVTVVRATAVVTAGLATRPVTTVDQAVVPVRVTAAGGRAAGGQVRVLEGGDVLVAATDLDANGRARIEVPALGRGRHVLTVEYLGTDEVSAGTVTRPLWVGPAVVAVR